MVEVGIHSIKKWDVIKEIPRIFPNVLFFVGCHTTEYIDGSGCGGSVYRRRTPGKNKTINYIIAIFRLWAPAIFQFYPQSHSEYYAPFRRDQANTINPEHLFFIILDSIWLFCCFVLAYFDGRLERSIKFDCFDFLVRLCSITELNRTQSFD